MAMGNQKVFFVDTPAWSFIHVVKQGMEVGDLKLVLALKFFKCLFQVIYIHWFEDVIDAVNFKRPDSILIKGGDKNYRASMFEACK